MERKGGGGGDRGGGGGGSTMYGPRKSTLHGSLPNYTPAAVVGSMPSSMLIASHSLPPTTTTATTTTTSGTSFTSTHAGSLRRASNHTLVTQSIDDAYTGGLLVTSLNPSLTPPPSLPLPHGALRDGRKSDALNLLLNDPDALYAYDQFQQTPLHIVADKGFEDLVTLFLQRGAKPNAVDKNGWTPLHNACRNGHFLVAKILLERNADPALLTAEGATALHYLVRQPFDTKPDLCREVLELFIEKAADVNMQNHHGDTPLHGASFKGVTESIQFLLSSGANVNLANNKGETSLHFVARTDYYDVAKQLLAYGGNVLQRGDNGNCLDVATPEMQNLFKEHLTALGLSIPNPTVSEDAPLKDFLVGPQKIRPRQRRLRHVQRIAGRNIQKPGIVGKKPDRDLFDVFFSLHVTEQGPALYISEVVASSLNPSWRDIILPTDNLIANPAECVAFIVHVWEWRWNANRKETHALLFTTSIDLNRLGYVGDLAALGDLPPNTLVFACADYYYLPISVINAMMRIPGNKFTRFENLDIPTKESCTYDDFSKVITTYYELRIQEAHAAQHEQAIVSGHRRLAAGASIIQKRDKTRLRVEWLRREVEKRAEVNKNAKVLVQVSQAELLPRHDALQEYKKSLQRNKRKLRKQMKAIEVEKRHEKASREFLQRIRTKLVTNLELVYPLGQAQKCMTIVGLHLPDAMPSYNYFEDEEIASALGCAAHVTSLAAKYLGVPLRYNISVRSSRSSIIDCTAETSQAVFYPLYLAGKRSELETAISLLNKNIKMLLYTLGLPPARSNAILPNLKILITQKPESPPTSLAPSLASTPAISSLGDRLLRRSSTPLQRPAGSNNSSAAGSTVRSVPASPMPLSFGTSYTNLNALATSFASQQLLLRTALRENSPRTQTNTGSLTYTTTDSVPPSLPHYYSSPGILGRTSPQPSPPQFSPRSLDEATSSDEDSYVRPRHFAHKNNNNNNNNNNTNTDNTSTNSHKLKHKHKHKYHNDSMDDTVEIENGNPEIATPPPTTAPKLKPRPYRPLPRTPVGTTPSHLSESEGDDIFSSSASPSSS
eukprot:TRINITY_DN2831_c3_g1_i2.p1 TRINITY_DN2831_c3_g1~~TRINITY_DN2831_c3_g1_i2.p1  ORF type:complete len:1061 (+),score=149.31 TRINITY_DN2831_c3_g1_i2:81-3263(+)